MYRSEMTSADASATPRVALIIAEYQAGLELSRHWSALRRQDMLLVTTVQGAIFTIIGGELLKLKSASIALSIVAFLVALIGFNSERRLSAYIRANVDYLKTIEKSNGLGLLTTANDATLKIRGMVSNKTAFLTYYAFMAAGWVVVWLVNTYV